MTVPDFVTHYYLHDRAPFRNLTDVTPGDLPQVLEALSGTSQRMFGPRYLDLRRRTEARLRDLFVEAGGRPQRTSPHYFVLGESPWFRGLADDMREVRLPLEDLPPDVTSLTWCDSFEAMGLGPDYGLPYEPRAHHRQAFRLADIPRLAQEHGLPASGADTGYADYHLRSIAFYVEVQVWSDDPVRSWLRSAT